MRFGEDVAPAVRAAVAEHRAANGTATATPGAVRGPRARGLRRAGIDYDAVPDGLAGTAVEPGDPTYARVRSTYVRSGAPGLVLQPADAAQVASALTYAREQDVPLAVRSGGHGISGRSTNDGGIVVDLGALRDVDVLDASTGRVRVGAGARWGEVAQALGPHGLGMSSGDYGDVGVGGVVTAGGLGLLGRLHGLTIDHVAAYEVVLSDGTLVRAGAEQHPDLFWALRGAGGNFGIVTAVEFDAYPVGDVVVAQFAYDADEALLERWASSVIAAPRELTSFLTVVGRGAGAAVAHALSVYADDDVEAATDALTPLLHAGRLLDQQAQLVPYHAVVPPHGGVHRGGSTRPAMRSGLLDRVSADAAQALMSLVREGHTPFAQLRAAGGAINDVDPQATAYAHRHQAFSATAVGQSLERLNPVWDARMVPHVDGLYLSLDTDTRPERLHEAFPEPTLTRLRELKATYDPRRAVRPELPDRARRPHRRHRVTERQRHRSDVDSSPAGY